MRYSVLPALALALSMGGDDVAARRQSPAKEHDLRGPEVLLTPNATYHIRLVARDGQAEFWRDGKRVFSFKDPQPLKSGWFGIRTVNSHLRISGFRVHSPADGMNGP